MNRIAAKIRSVVSGDPLKRRLRRYGRQYAANIFSVQGCRTPEQYEACMTKLYHAIEKGLSYENYRPGFGRDNIDVLLGLLERYAAAKLDTSAECYETALSCLDAYTKKNAEHGLVDQPLNERIGRLPGSANTLGGVVSFVPPTADELRRMDYETFVGSRHSIRHFAPTAVDTERLKKAVELAGRTPSACNRQGWSTVIITDKNVIKNVLANQNGNRGFGEEIDKLLLVTADIRYFNGDRELFQPYIDGGMFAQSLLNSLYYYGIGAIPLSAALNEEQEKHIRELLSLSDAEVPILFIGTGNYPENCVTTASHRRPVRSKVI